MYWDKQRLRPQCLQGYARVENTSAALLAGRRVKVRITHGIGNAWLLSTSGREKLTESLGSICGGNIFKCNSRCLLLLAGPVLGKRGRGQGHHTPGTASNASLRPHGSSFCNQHHLPVASSHKGRRMGKKGQKCGYARFLREKVSIAGLRAVLRATLFGETALLEELGDFPQPRSRQALRSLEPLQALEP